MLVRVKMLTTGPNKNHKAGSKIDVDAARAATWVAGKHAEYTEGGENGSLLPEELQAPGGGV